MTTPTSIDASPTYQPDAAADATALHAAGITRAVLKATEGQTWPDPGSPEADWYGPTAAALRAAGIETETYHLTHDADQVQLEIANLRRIIGHDPGAAIWVDVETTEGNPAVMGTHTRELIAALRAEFPGVPVGRYDNRSVDGAVGPYDPDERIWLAWPGWDGQELPAAVVRVQTGHQQIGAHTYDVDVDITPTTATPAPAPEPQPAPAPTVQPAPAAKPAVGITPRTLDLRNAGHQLVTGPAVHALQALLSVEYHLTIDGKAGQVTAGVLGQFQRAHGLTPDLIAGPATWTALVAQ